MQEDLPDLSNNDIDKQPADDSKLSKKQSTDLTPEQQYLELVN